MALLRCSAAPLLRCRCRFATIGPLLALPGKVLTAQRADHRPANGAVDIWADDRFGTGTAEFVICRNCGVYIGTIGETESGTRAVINTTCLANRALFTLEPAPTDHSGETTEERLARRAATWTPATIHR
jgi:hypothetical protein